MLNEEWWEQKSISSDEQPNRPSDIRGDPKKDNFLKIFKGKKILEPDSED